MAVVYLSKIYTKSGDDGQTMLADGTRVSKDDQRIRAYGDIDELNAVIGLVRLEITRDTSGANPSFLTTLDQQLARIQQELFNLGAQLATPQQNNKPPKLRVEARHVTQLEQDIDGWNDALEPLRSFILPGGGAVASVAHLARTVCRRAERELIALTHQTTVDADARQYVNRLSDYLFVISRAAAHQLGHDEVLWDPQST